jgi:hypothetical protein
MGAGAGQLGAAGQTFATGAGTAATAGGLYGQAQGLQEQYGMDTAQMANIYSGMQNQLATNTLGSIANAGQMWQKRPFGIGGTNAAQAELGQASALNSFNQANYATMQGIAQYQQQVGTQQAQLNAANNAATTSTIVGAGTTAASTVASVAAMSAMCWVARAVYPDNRWKVFRHWLMNKAPAFLRRAYMRHGESFSHWVTRSRLLRLIVKLLMDQVVERTVYVGYS